MERYTGSQIGRTAIFDRASAKKSLARFEGITIVSDEISSPYFSYSRSATSSINVFIRKGEMNGKIDRKVLRDYQIGNLC
jgi:hypothetical protein